MNGRHQTTVEDNPTPGTTAHPAEQELLSDTTQSMLLAIWQELFENSAIGVDDSFFILGGHSLLAARLATRVHEQFGVELPPHQLFETTTVAALAAYIDQQGEDKTIIKPSASFVVPLNAPGVASRPPFFCIHAIMGTVYLYQVLAQSLGPDQPVYGIAARGSIGEESPPDTMAELVEHCINQLRMQQPHGPYYLGGHSYAGFLALEVARELHARGEKVALLALFDCWLRFHPAWPQWYNSIRWQFNWYFTRIKRRLRVVIRPERQWNTLPAEQRMHDLVVQAKAHANGQGSKRGAAATILDNSQAAERVQKVVLAALTASYDGAGVASYPGRIAYFQSAVRTEIVWFDQRSAWAMIAGGELDFYRVPGTHLGMLLEPNVYILGKQLGECLQKAQLEEMQSHAEPVQYQTV